MLANIINAVPRGYEVAKRMTFDTQMLLLFKLLGGVLLLSQMRKLFLGTLSRNGSPLDQLSEATSVALQTQESRVALAAVAITIMLLSRRRLSRRAPVGAPPPENTLTILPPERIREAAAVAAAAFAEPTRSNAWVAVCGTDASLASRHALLRYIFERNFQLRLRTRCNRALFREGRLVCCFMFVTPEVANVSLWEMLRVGLVAMPLYFGWGTVRRLLAIKNSTEDQFEAARVAHGLLGKPVCMLERMVVHPADQGRGIGTQALRQVLAEADAAGWPMLLGTNEERNVVFYERVGFEVVHRKEETVDGYSFLTFTMLRRPAAMAAEMKKAR